MLDRLTRHWVYGGFLCGLLLLLLAPVLVGSWPPVLAVTYLALPAYMLHQYEEHDADRFRLAVNETVGGGYAVLTTAAVFWINVPGVWGVIGLSLHLAVTRDAGFALVPAYLMLVNAAVHLGHAIVARRYNPGLATACAVFVPLGEYAVVLAQQAGRGSIEMHAIALAVTVGLHVAMVAYALRRRAALAG